MKDVVAATRYKYCDIISINYYSRWSPELDHTLKLGEWTDTPFLVAGTYIPRTGFDLNNLSEPDSRFPTQNNRAMLINIYAGIAWKQKELRRMALVQKKYQD